MQITSQAVALCQEFDHPNLGIVFNGYHWYASQEGRLEQRLEAIKPWLMQVDLSGSAMSPLGWGELDNFAVVAALNRIGYTGRIGILGWDYGGDIYLKLQRCLATMRAIDARLQARPHWAEIEPRT